MRELFFRFYRLGFAAIIFAAFFIPSLPTNLSAQQSQETWGDFINEPEISYGELRSAQAHLEDERIIMSIFSDFDCEEEEFPIVGEATYPACWYKTGGHRTTEGGQGYVPAGETKAGFMKDFATLLFPTRFDDVLIEQSANYDRAWIRKGDALNATLLEDPEGANPNFWLWDNPASLELLNEDGTPFNFHGNYLYAQATFSNNGRWLLLFDTTGYLIRIDLENLNIATFRVADENEDFWPAIAISDSGRYIAVNNRVGEFFILDADSCLENYSYIKMPTNDRICKTRSITAYAEEYFDRLLDMYAHFYNDDLLGLRGISKDGDGLETIVRAPNTRLGKNYIALGDSYSSGEGAYNYITGTDDPDNRCHLSSKSYPFLLDEWLKLDSTHSVACSGAKINNIAGGHVNDAAQNEKLPANNSLGKWLPGYKWQLDHIKDGENPVDIVTVGITGNDIGFSDKIKECLKPSTCFSSTYDRVGISLEINYQFDRLVALYSSVRSQALKRSPTARVYAIGYPQIFSATGSKNGLCGNNVRLNYDEIAMSENLINYLNSVIRQAATKAGVVYVSIEGALNGYRLCDKTSTNAVNGLTAGQGRPLHIVGPFANESYHPAYFGHTLIAEVVKQKTYNFELTLPKPDKTATAPDPLRNPLVGNASDITEEVRRLIYGGEISSEIVLRGTNQYLFLDGKYKLKVGAEAIVLFRSDPVIVGKYNIDNTSELSINYTVPSYIDPGIHTLHILAEDTNGEKIDIYKTLYVAAHEHDWDGDGVPNNQELCGIFQSVGKDLDLDGIDDGCDDIISEIGESTSVSKTKVNQLSLDPPIESLRRVQEQPEVHAPNILDEVINDNFATSENNSDNKIRATSNTQDIKIALLVIALIGLTTTAYLKVHTNK